MLSKWLPIVVALSLAAGGEARADKKVDWSEYLEPAGAKPPVVKHQDLVPAAKAAKAAPVAAKPAAAKAKRKPAARHR